MSHVSLYRKWRPQTFEDVVGQERVTRTLQNAIAGGRIVHAYLFCGHRGSGKTTTARILAKGLNCRRGPTPTPCGVCDACVAITAGTSLDVIEIDAASNRGIDEIRDLREKVRLVPVEGRYKLYIIDEAHMLTTEAANALLKTLEEPPPHAILVLVTTEPHRLPSTITSRTQRFDFKRIPQAAIVTRLRTIASAESLAADDDALHLIARAADGALRDAESLLDQLDAFCKGTITKADVLAVLGVVDEEVAHRLAQAVIDGDAARCLALTAQIIDEGRDVRQILRSLVEQFRDLLVVAVVGDPRDIVETTDQRLDSLREQAGRIAPGAIAQQIRLFAAAEADARTATQPRVVLEMALLRAARPELDPSLEALASRVTALEQGAPARAPGPREGEAPPVPRGPREGGHGATPAASQKTEPPVRETPSTAKPARRVPSRAGTQARPNPARSTDAGMPVEAGLGAPSGLTIEALRVRWADVMDDVKQRTRAVHAHLLESAPRDVSGDEIVLGVRHQFHLEQLDDRKSRLVLRDALARVFGAPFRVRLTVDETAETEADPLAQPIPGDAASGAVRRDAPSSPASGAVRRDAPSSPASGAVRRDAPSSRALVDEAIRRFGNPVQEVRRPE